MFDKHTLDQFTAIMVAADKGRISIAETVDKDGVKRTVLLLVGDNRPDGSPWLLPAAVFVDSSEKAVALMQNLTGVFSFPPDSKAAEILGTRDDATTSTYVPTVGHA